MKKIAIGLIIIIYFTNCSKQQNQYTIDITNTEIKIYSDHLKLGGINFKGEKISVNNYYLTMNDSPVIPVTGEFHYARYPNKYWEESIRKMKAGGIDIIATYVFWIIHEENEGIFDWSGDKNLRRFVELCAKNNVKAIIRIGPFCHGEIRNGGLPDWLLSKPLIIRSNDPEYLKYVERLYYEIGKQLEGLLFKDGGPIFAIQLENEFQHSAAPWGITYPGQPYDWTSAERDGPSIQAGVGITQSNNPYAKYGNEHMKILKSLAIKAGLEVPVYTATGWGNAAVIENESLPVTGAYAYPTWAPKNLSSLYLYTDLQKNPDYAPIRYKSEDYPYFAAEIGGGIMIKYDRRPTVPANSLDALINRFLGSGTNGIGYYMLHGGSTPQGKKIFYSDEAYAYPKISYDFQAPLGEYGQVRPSFNRLKLIHFFLKSFGNELAPMAVVLPDNQLKIKPENTSDLRFSIRAQNYSGYIFMSNFQDHLETKDISNIQFILKTNKGELYIPESSTFTLKSEENAIFPFNLNLGGILLNYSTAQLLTKINHENKQFYIFFSLEGIEPEFSITKEKEMIIESAKGIIEEDSQRYLIKFNEQLPAQFTIKKQGNSEIKVLVIDKNLATKVWINEIKDNECLLFSDALILQNNKSLELYQKGNNIIEFKVYPVISSFPNINFGELEVISGSDELFASFRITLPEKKYNPVTNQLASNKLSLIIPTEKPEFLNDIFLEINYQGDNGLAFINGELIADNLYNGNNWEIGLKKFQELKDNKEIVLYFRPLYNGATFFKDFSADIIPDFSETRKFLKINNIEYIPEYKSVIQFK